LAVMGARLSPIKATDPIKRPRRRMFMDFIIVLFPVVFFIEFDPERADQQPEDLMHHRLRLEEA
jgi:hypothetical protein